MKRVYYYLRYVVIFLWELAWANVAVAKLVLSPKMRIKPGFLAVPMDATTDLEVTSLANSITLTPGTITVHVSDDRNAIVVHCLDTQDEPDAVRSSIKLSLEANILMWTRPDWVKPDDFGKIEHLPTPRVSALVTPTEDDRDDVANPDSSSESGESGESSEPGKEGGA